jgi:hypothetical protein
MIYIPSFMTIVSGIGSNVKVITTIILVAVMLVLLMGGIDDVRR